MNEFCELSKAFASMTAPAIEVADAFAKTNSDLNDSLNRACAPYIIDDTEEPSTN